MTEQEARRRFASIGEKQLGRFAEELWARIFGMSGLRYIPLCRIEKGGAPMVEGNEPIVLPDYECIDPKWVAFIEVKGKRHSVLYRIANDERHGVDRKNFHEYERASALRKQHCGLAILELFRESCDVWSGSLLVESLKELGAPVPGYSNQFHMVYWPRKRFVDLDSWDALGLLEIRHGRKQVSYRAELEKIFSPPVEVQLQLL